MNDFKKKYANLKFSGLGTNSPNLNRSKVFHNLLNSKGICYKIIRKGDKLFEYKGIINTEEPTGRKYIGFEPCSDIKPLDILVNPANEKVYVVEIQTQYYLGNAFQIKAYYQTQYEHDNFEKQTGNTIFNITNPTNSIIGNNNIATINCDDLLSELKTKIDNIAEDKAELQQIVSLLEIIIEEKLPPQKGLFAKFSATMEKHSWITSAISNILLNWLINPPL